MGYGEIAGRNFSILASNSDKAITYKKQGKLCFHQDNIFYLHLLPYMNLHINLYINKFIKKTLQAYSFVPVKSFHVR